MATLSTADVVARKAAAASPSTAAVATALPPLPPLSCCHFCRRFRCLCCRVRFCPCHSVFRRIVEMLLTLSLQLRPSRLPPPSPRRGATSSAAFAAALATASPQPQPRFDATARRRRHRRAVALLPPPLYRDDASATDVVALSCRRRFHCPHPALSHCIRGCAPAANAVAPSHRRAREPQAVACTHRHYLAIALQQLPQRRVVISARCAPPSM